MIGALILGLFLGVIGAIVGIVIRWWTGTPTLVTAGGWAMAPLRWGGWGILIGALVACAEVLSGSKLRETWGLRFIASSLGSMAGGLVAWLVWTKLSNPAQPAPAVEEKKA